MCVSDIENIQRINLFTQEEKEDYVHRVYIGFVTLASLDVNQYLKVARKLSESVEKGFNPEGEDFMHGTEESLLIDDLIESAQHFAAAKQYQLVRELLQLLDESIKNNTSKKELTEEGLKVFDKYNSQYLAIEVVNFELQGAGARKWIGFVKWNNDES